MPFQCRPGVSYIEPYTGEYKRVPQRELTELERIDRANSIRLIRSFGMYDFARGSAITSREVKTLKQVFEERGELDWWMSYETVYFKGAGEVEELHVLYVYQIDQNTYECHLHNWRTGQTRKVNLHAHTPVIVAN